jgi:hypothetical protein
MQEARNQSESRSRITTITSVRRTDEPVKSAQPNRDGVAHRKRIVRIRFVARMCLIAGLLAVIPAFFLPGTYPLNPRLEPRVWYVVGGDWLGIGIALLILGILIGAISRHFDLRHPF